MFIVFLVAFLYVLFKTSVCCSVYASLYLLDHFFRGNEQHPLLCYLGDGHIAFLCTLMLLLIVHT